MFKITEFTQNATGAVSAPHLLITLTGRGDLDLGPVDAAVFGELREALDAVEAQYDAAASAWTNEHGAGICCNLALAFQAAGCGEVYYDANGVFFTRHGAGFARERHNTYLGLTWEYPVPLPAQWYSLPDFAFSGTALAPQILADLDARFATAYPPLPDDPTPTLHEQKAATWIWRRLDTGSSLAAPEVAAIFTTGKFEYEPVRLPVVVLEILRQAVNSPSGCRRGQRQERMWQDPQFAKWYLAYGHALRVPAPAPEPTAPTSVFLQ
ncbi:MAG TPA: hypothetical protein PKH77_19905 [Anaerolineae bacterium]|nr:hypothetical protein [Anaerolineae bacterium]